jgi:hypothetical protein
MYGNTKSLHPEDGGDAFLACKSVGRHNPEGHLSSLEAMPLSLGFVRIPHDTLACSAQKEVCHSENTRLLAIPLCAAVQFWASTK